MTHDDFKLTKNTYERQAHEVVKPSELFEGENSSLRKTFDEVVNTPQDNKEAYIYPSIEVDGHRWIRLVDHVNLLTSRDADLKGERRRIIATLREEEKDKLYTELIAHLEGMKDRTDDPLRKFVQASNIVNTLLSDIQEHLRSNKK